VAEYRIVVNGRRQRLTDRQRFLADKLMGRLRGVDVEDEIGWLAKHFVAEIDGKPEVDHGFRASAV
jgi:hypothetical protein